MGTEAGANNAVWVETSALGLNVFIIYRGGGVTAAREAHNLETRFDSYVRNQKNIEVGS